MYKPKLLVHKNDGKLYAFRGFNRIAWRFGNGIKVCRVEQVFGHFYRKISGDFFESIDFYSIPEGAQ